MEDINKIIGKNLLQLRKNARLTQMELADIFNYSDKSISKWETGESLPSIETLYDICVFYGVTLDALTKEEMPVPREEEKPKKNLLPARLIITLLAVSAVWLLATILFVTFKISLNKNIGYFFLWAVPISFVVLLVFNCIWGKKHLLFAILTVLIWTTLACIHVQLLKHNLWMIYLLGIPLQVAVILWGALLKKPHKTKAKKNNLKQSNTGTKETINAEKSNLKFKREKKNNKKFAAQPTLIAEQNVENIPSSSSVAANENFSTLLGENANSNFGKIQPAEMNEKNMPIEINIETKTVETNQEFKAAEINKENKTAEIEKENQENKANKTNKVLDANKTNKKAKAKKNKDDDDFGFDFIKNKER